MMVTTPPSFKKVLGSDADEPYLKAGHQAIVVIQIAAWTELDEEALSRAMPGMLDNVMRRVWSSLTAAGQHIGQLKIYLKYDEEQAPDLSEWHKKNKDKGRKTGSELCANEREWAEEFYNDITGKYSSIVYAFVTDDHLSEYNPFWIQLHNREGIVAAHHHRYAPYKGYSAVQTERAIEKMVQEDPYYYYYYKHAETDTGPSNEDRDTNQKTEKDKTAGFMSFLNNVVGIYKDICEHDS